MPGSDQRDAERMGGRETEDAKIAGPGDVDDVRLKLAQVLDDEFPVADQGGVAEQLFVEAERGRTALQGDGGEPGLLGDLGLGSSVDAEEGVAAAGGEGCQLAADGSDTIRLVIGVCKERYAQRSSQTFEIIHFGRPARSMADSASILIFDLIGYGEKRYFRECNPLQPKCHFSFRGSEGENPARRG